MTDSLRAPRITPGIRRLEFLIVNTETQALAPWVIGRPSDWSAACIHRAPPLLLLLLLPPTLL